jgi:hypothetical protein
VLEQFETLQDIPKTNSYNILEVMVHLMRLSISSDDKATGCILGNEFERMWKEALVT